MPKTSVTEESMKTNKSKENTTNVRKSGTDKVDSSSKMSDIAFELLAVERTGHEMISKKSIENVKNSNYHFAMSLVGSLNALPNYIQLKAKIAILQTIEGFQEFEYEKEKCDNNVNEINQLDRIGAWSCAGDLGDSFPVDEADRYAEDGSTDRFEFKEGKDDVVILNPTKENVYSQKDEPKTRSNSRKMCELCGKSMRTTFFEGHLNMHLGLKPFVCGIKGCSNTFSCKHGRRKHIYLVHSEEKFSCPECKKECKSKNQLSTHRLQEHIRGSAFGCPKCGKFFKVRATLKKHILTHTGENRGKCSYCPRMFACAKTAKTHELIHTNKKPYRCLHCTEVFRYYQQWKNHSRVKHKNHQTENDHV